MCLLPDDCAPRATQAGAGRLRSGLAPGREVVEGVVSQDGATVDAPVALLVTALAASLGLLMGSQPMDTTTIWINRWTSFQRPQPASAAVAEPEYLHLTGAPYFLHRRGDPPASLAEQLGRQEARVRGLREAAGALDQPPLASHVAHDEAALYLTNSLRAAEQTVAELQRVATERGPDALPVVLVDDSVGAGLDGVSQDWWDMDAGLLFGHL